MTLRLNSNSFKDGDYLQDKHALSADYGFGCDGEMFPRNYTGITFQKVLNL